MVEWKTSIFSSARVTEINLQLGQNNTIYHQFASDAKQSLGANIVNLRRRLATAERYHNEHTENSFFSVILAMALNLNPQFA